VPQFEGFGCTATQYCAAITIDSRTLHQNHGAPGSMGTENTAACNNYVLGGPEPVNWAYITKSGRSQAPANPLFSGTLTDPVFTAINPNLSEDVLMNPGDRILTHMHDAPAGFQVNLFNLTTGQSGSMSASIPNGIPPRLVHPELERVSRGAVRLPSRVRHSEPAREHLDRSQLQHRDVSTIAFETDLPAIESSVAQFNPPFCDLNTGANCVDPPDGGRFYPFFTTGTDNGTCTWQEGGNFIPGTFDHFGGSAAAEFGSLLRIVFPVPTFTTAEAIQDFNSGDMPNACPVGPFFGGGGR